MTKPNPASRMTQIIPSIAEMESRAQKPQRPQIAVSIDNVPVSPAEAVKVPVHAPPGIAVTATDPRISED